jgi:TPR repeat protein
VSGTCHASEWNHPDGQIPKIVDLPLVRWCPAPIAVTGVRTAELRRNACLCLSSSMFRLVAATCCCLAAIAASRTAAAQDFGSGLSAYNSGDYTRAFHDWFGLAEQGDAKAEAGIGFLFHKGLGVSRDDGEASTWLIKAAEQGQAEAQLLLGSLFFFGEGVPQSYVTAYAWCDIAQTSGQSDAEECREAALEHMSTIEMRQSFKLVTDWFGRHPSAGR